MTLITTAFGQMLRRRPMKVGTSRIGGARLLHDHLDLGDSDGLQGLVVG
jgi:hypothetical protein